MPDYITSVETTSNATAGASGTSTALQFLMPASREAILLGVFLWQEATAAGETDGRWVVDRITAVTAGSALTPLKLEDTSAASAITDTAKTISTTLACTNTVQDAAILEIPNLGWTWFHARGITYRSGVNKGFALRRATAPTGARVVRVAWIWREI